MPIRLPALCTFALLLAAAPALSAQIAAGHESLAEGQRARVTYQRFARPLIAEFVSADTGEIVLRRSDGQSYYITWDNVARLEASLGQRSRAEMVARGTTAGLATGLFFNANVILVSRMIGWKTRWWPEWMGDSGRDLVIITTASSTIGGLLLGMHWSPDLWERVPLEDASPRLTIQPLPDGRMGVGLSLVPGFRPSGR